MVRPAAVPQSRQPDAVIESRFSKGNGKKRLLLMVLLPLLVIVGAAAFYLAGGRYVVTDNAYIKADKVVVSSEVSGKVVKVLVKENESVTAGQTLFVLDDQPFKVAVAKAEARLAQVATDLRALKAGYRQKQATIELAQSKLDYAKNDERRQKDLMAKNYISSSSFDETRQNTKLAGLQITVLEQDLKVAAETLGGSVGTPVQQHPSYLMALAELNEAQLDLQRVEVKAVEPGIVTRPPKPGQYVAAGSLALALVASDHLWVEANFTETDLTNVRRGQSVSVHVDTYPGISWESTVDSLSPATGSEFSVIPAQNATGNWVKIAQRVPVRINLKTSPDLPQLRAGLSTEVEIDTGHRRSFFGLSL